MGRARVQIWTGLTSTCLCLLIIWPTSSFAGTFTKVAVHPDAAAQTTSTGRTIATLCPFNGKIYAGFGDYQNNTGPVGIRPFAPTTDTFGSRLLNSGTEAVYLFRTIGTKLYAPHIDPLAGESSGGYAVGSVSGATETWTDRFPVSALHVFDVATYGGSDLWMAGSAGNNATLWRSVDGGTNWSVALSQAPDVFAFTRFYGLGAYNAKLYVQEDEAAVSKVFDGATWTDGPDLIPASGYMWQPETFAGQLVYMSSHFSSALYRFNGTQVQVALDPVGSGGGGSTGGPPRGIHDFTIADGVLFTLGVDGIVRWTDDLQTWHDLVATAPAEARSLAVLNSHLFLGGTDSSIYRYSDTVVPEPAAALAPLIGLTLIWLRRSNR